MAEDDKTAVAWTWVGVRLHREKLWSTANCDCLGIDRTQAYCHMCGQKNAPEAICLYKKGRHQVHQAKDEDFYYICLDNIESSSNQPETDSVHKSILSLEDLIEGSESLYQELVQSKIIKDRNEFEQAFGIYTEAFLENFNEK